MIVCTFLKSLCELSLFFVLANGVLAITNGSVESLLPVFVCAAVSAVAYYLNSKNSALRLLPIPLLLLAFQGLHTFGTKLAVGLAVLYTALNILDRRFTIEKERQISIYRLLLDMLCCCQEVIVCLL